MKSGENHLGVKMNEKKEITIEEYVDQRRWLLNNGFITDDVKNQLFFCGSIAHKEVQAVELDLTPEQRLVSYKIYVNSDLIKKISKYHVLSKSTSLFGMWRFKRLLQQEGVLDFQQVLSKLVKDYCGPMWNVTVQVVDFNTYVDTLGEQSGPQSGQQPDKLPK
jgi:hypothetical protein